MTIVRFRPHHFLCALGFSGKGYSPSFIKNFTKICESITTNAKIQVTFSLDDVCGPCPHHDNKVCSKQSFIEQLDKRHANVLQLQEGDILSWKEARHKIKTSISLKVFHEICQGCSWKDYNICEQALDKLQELESRISRTTSKRLD